MTDRELLEKAAKAAGIHIYTKETFVKWIELYKPELEGLFCVQGAYRAWNPLIDGDAALRLAVKLDIDVRQFQTSERVEAWLVSGNKFTEEYGTDPFYATCRVIVRAAAAIGETL